jgi:N-acetylneuraminate synthase/N,N'-diacetyllegionaminate synthase
MKDVRIGDEKSGFVRVGPGRPVAVMAEVGINHEGDPKRALELVDLAVDAGADLIKFQYIDPPAMVHKGLMPDLFDIYARYTLEFDDYRRIAERCRSKKIPFVCTVFDAGGAARMAEAGVAAFKVASCDMTHLPLLKSLAQWSLPVILSTGLSDFAEVRQSVRTLKRAGCKTPVLLHCTSCYPAPPESLNLSSMRQMQSKLRLPVGLSDHSEGYLAPALAAGMGACMIEKHFTYDPAADGPDHALSLGPEQFADMVSQIRLADKMRGDGRKRPAAVEQAERTVGRRGFYLARDVKAGERVRLDHLVALKPWTPVGPFQLTLLRGKSYTRDISAGDALGADDFSPVENSSED